MSPSELAESKAQNRAIVLDAEVLWGGSTPQWSADRIRSALSWYDFDSPDQYSWPIVVIDRNNDRETWRSEEAIAAWTTIARQVSYEIPTRLSLIFWDQSDIEEFSMGGKPRRFMNVRVLTREMFDDLEQYQANVREMLDEIGQSQVNIVDALIEEACIFGFVDLNQYHGTEALVDALSAGHIGVRTNLVDDGEDGLSEAVVLSLDESQQVVARGFYIPRFYDPSGHLP